MTRLCLLAFSVCLYVASITCTEGAIARPQKGTDEKSSRGEPLKGISNDVLAKLNSDQDLERFWQNVSNSELTLEPGLKNFAEFAKNELKSYPALLKRLKSVAKILSSDPFFVKACEILIKEDESTSPPNSQSDLELFLEKELRSNLALARKLKDIVTEAMKTDPDLEQVLKNPVFKGLSENFSTEKWNKILNDAIQTNPDEAMKLYKFVEHSLSSVQSVVIVYTAFGNDL